MNRRRSLYLPAGSFASQIARYEEETVRWKPLWAAAARSCGAVRRLLLRLRRRLRGRFPPEALEDLTIDGFRPYRERAGAA
ncbi:MAG: hypothetical protein ACLUFV_04610 [Acutalibacteraceae bacterium]